MYFAFNFMVDDFEDICVVANTSINARYHNVDLDVEDSFMKCNSYEYILSNYNQFNNFSNFSDFRCIVQAKRSKPRSRRNN